MTLNSHLGEFMLSRLLTVQYVYIIGDAEISVKLSFSLTWLL